ncbi:hypothetical protein AQJ91_37465 [Streptomyces dysideae]|uniref:Oligopeptide/dipeptide ABC transporter C-terminal domain-containing protein n=1 Tax=Streptomyces dysideae TaxID=909626 RepID=A0A124IDS9_9ACTN|nr:hypothetical protein AQJ91_37465 [Streptomyces dysideae]
MTSTGFVPRRRPVAAEPDLIIADEATTALDVTVQAEVLDLIRALRQERGMAVLLVTHNFGVVADICDRVSVMRQGGVVETSDTAGLFRAVATAYVWSPYRCRPRPPPGDPLAVSALTACAYLPWFLSGLQIGARIDLIIRQESRQRVSVSPGTPGDS